jgi:hypothetical protein
MASSQSCEFCQDISIQRLLRSPPQLSEVSFDPMYRVPSTFYPHQPSVSALKQSAVNGCGFCQFMVDCLNATASSASDRPSTDELATTVSLGLYVDTASENGKEVFDAHNVGLFFIQLKSAFPTVRCNFDLFTPSGTHLFYLCSSKADKFQADSIKLQHRS